MFNIKKMTINMWHVLAEPGDATRYDFIVARRMDGSKKWSIMPWKSNFQFPQQITDYEIEEIRDDMEVINEFSKKFNCNPCTTTAVISAIELIKKDIGENNEK